MQSILFTGGGSAGHVTPNIAIIQSFITAGWQVSYIGSKQGIEREIIKKLGIPYYSISSGKLRRYFSWRTFLAPLAIFTGVLQSYFLCYRLKPQVIFSKGGFVAFPVVVGAWLNRIPVVIHESDLTPGLANRLCFPFAKKICVAFEESKTYIPYTKIRVTGNPIRLSLLEGKSEKGKELCQFNSQDPILLVMGGGQGATIINQTIRRQLSILLETFQIIHLCGKGKVDATFQGNSRYKQFEYVDSELPDLLACADLVVSRAGANTLYELLLLKKPHILIPLSRKASRGDQIINAEYFTKLGLSTVLPEEALTEESLLNLIRQVYEKKANIYQKMLDFSLPDSNQLIYKEIIQLSSKKLQKDQ